MKILHTSDWHLGMALNGYDMSDDQRFFIDRICDIIREHGVEAVMLCGDVFDRSAPSADAVRLYDDAVTRICAGMGVRLLVIAGNHDSPVRVSTYGSLVKAAGLHVAGVLDPKAAPVELGGADVHMLPWFSMDSVRAAYPERAEEVGSLEAAYRIVLDGLRSRFRPGRRNILMAHAYIVDAATSVSDRAAEVGRAAAVGADLFEGFDYVALGHLHGPQSIGARIRYCGTPMKYSFGAEEGQEKSVTIIDTETMEAAVVPVPALRERTTVSGTYAELLAGGGLDEARRTGYVRAEISDRPATLGTWTELEAVYPYLRESAGMAFEREDAGISMTLDELRSRAGNPEDVFRSFVADTMSVPLSEGFMELFNTAVKNCGEESDEAD